MNLEKIKEILDVENIPEDMKKAAIIQVLSEDKDLIPILLRMLHYQRLEEGKIILEASLALATSHHYIHSTKVTGQKRTINREIVLNRIKEFYKKYKGKVDHHFRRSQWGNENLKDIYD